MLRTVISPHDADGPYGEGQPGPAAEHLNGTAVSPTASPLLDCTFKMADLARVRRRVAGCAASTGLRDPRLSDFVLAVNEVATHAVLYGGGKGHIRLHHANIALRCIITHDGPGPPRPTPPTGLSHNHRTEHSLGLQVARAAVDWFDIVTCTAMTTVTLVTGLD